MEDLKLRGRALACLLASCVFGIACEPAPDPSGFSVVLVTLDTTRADHLGAFGGTRVPTPHLDAVIEEGVRFDAATSQVPLTLPSHASILTGKYPSSHGVRHNGIYRLRESEETLPERLSQEGFQTAAFVASYVLNKGFGTEQGFALYDDIPRDRYQGGRDQLYEAERTADEVNAAVFEWLEHRKPGRFFLWVHYYDPHFPYRPPESPHALVGDGYDREISYVDACFGDLMDRLRREKLLDNSILIIAGDHGESLGEHREKSHGVFLYESALRVPLAIRAPGLLSSGRVIRNPVELIDIAPTVLELLGLGPLEQTQGTSLVAMMRSRWKGESRPVFAESLMPRIEFGWSELRMIRSAGYKYIEAPRPELYDLAKDPGELVNLIDEEPQRVAEMAQALDEWVVDTSDRGDSSTAVHRLSADEQAKLRSLGYLGGLNSDPDGSGNRPDPKDKIEEGLKLNEARDNLVAGKPAEALSAVEQILSDNPRNHLALTTQVQALIGLQRLPEAEKAAAFAMAEASNDPEASAVLLEKARRVYASVLWMVGKKSEAEEEYRKALDLTQSNKSAAVLPGLLLGAAGGMQEALRIVEDALRRDPRDGMALTAKFELQVSQGHPKMALETAWLLSDVREGDAETLVEAGKLLLDSDDARRAAILFEVAHRKQPANPEPLGYLGITSLGRGDIEKAESSFEKVRQLAPTDARAPFYLGNIALLRNDEARARELYSTSIELNPASTAPLVNLALWLSEKGRFEEAVEALQQAARRAPENREIQTLLAKTRARTHPASVSHEP